MGKRKDKISKLLTFFQNDLLESKDNPSDFDIDVTNTLMLLQEKYQFDPDDPINLDPDFRKDVERAENEGL